MSVSTPHDLKTTLVVGLEIHVELATRSKMFTSAPNVAHPDFHDAEPNTLCDPVVVGMPGSLPVINKRAVELSMIVGLAINCEIAKFTKWDPKSYYYPDLPKNYQISQYDLPLCNHGHLDIPVAGSDEPKRIRILRAHLEETWRHGHANTKIQSNTFNSVISHVLSETCYLKCVNLGAICIYSILGAY